MFADSEDSAPFAHLLGRLLEGNLALKPAALRDFHRLRARIGFEATDVGESATLDFRGDRVTVKGGLESGCAIAVHGDSTTIMQLSNLKIGPGGIPVYFDTNGREVLGKLLRRELKVEGMTRHPGVLNRVTRLFSVQ